MQWKPNSNLGFCCQDKIRFKGAHQLKKSVEIYKRVRVDMIANHADKPKMLEVMKSCRLRQLCYEQFAFDRWKSDVNVHAVRYIIFFILISPWVSRNSCTCQVTGSDVIWQKQNDIRTRPALSYCLKGKSFIYYITSWDPIDAAIFAN